MDEAFAAADPAVEDPTISELAQGLTLFEGIINHRWQQELLLLVESWLNCGRAGTLSHGYQVPPQEWLETGQSREMLQFGVHVRCNKVRPPP